MAYTKEQIQRAIDAAKADGNDSAVNELTEMLGESVTGPSQTGGEPVIAPTEVGSGVNVPGATPIPSQGGLQGVSGGDIAAQPTPDGPALENAKSEGAGMIPPRTGKEGSSYRVEMPRRTDVSLFGDKDKDYKINQKMYESDQALLSDPANKPSPAELSDFMLANGMKVGSLDTESSKQVLVDPKTKQLRFAALPPEEVEKRSLRGKAKAQGKQAVGALASGTIRGVGTIISGTDTEIEEGNAFQKRLLEEYVPEPERKRLMALATERWGKDHRFVKNPGLIPANVLRDWMDQNPDNEKVLEELAGKEATSVQGETLGRTVSAAATSLRNALPFSDSLFDTEKPVFGGLADTPGGAITGREKYQGIEYEEGDAPRYPSASLDVNNWLEASSAPQGVYETVFKPILTGKQGEMPGERVKEVADTLAKMTYTDTGYASRSKGFLNPDVEVDDVGDVFQKELWVSDESKLPWNDPEGFWVTTLENAFNIATSLIAGRAGGRFSARQSWRDTANKGMTLSAREAARVKAAGRGGLIAGSGAEAVIVNSQVADDTRDSLRETPDEVWDKDSLFTSMVTEGGLDRETAKQILINDAASQASTMATIMTLALGGPMSHFVGKSAAGQLAGKQGALPRWAMGAGGEILTEGLQGTSEEYAKGLSVAQIDPENPIFDQPNRLLEAFVGEGISAGPYGAFASIQPNTPAGIEAVESEVAKAASAFMNATNDRFKFQTLISDPEHIAETSPNNRVSELHQLETLQKAEAEALLAAAPIMRAHLETQGTEVAQAEIKMLNALTMRSNAILHDISVNRTRRESSASLHEEEQRVISDRASLQQRVSENVIQLDDMVRQAKAIETVQERGAIEPSEQQELVKEGYAKTTKDGALVILPKGKRAIKELNRQIRGLTGRLEAGYLGEERRSPVNNVRRTLVEDASPEQREALLYEDSLTQAKNRRAFNERQENLDHKGEGEAKPVKGAAPVVAAVDVDGLAWVNENMDHAGGDRLLMAVSDALSKQKGVKVYRLGGDEFAVTGASEEAVETALQNAKTQLDETEITAGEDAISPQITWAKGKTYREADAKAVDMKSERVAKGKIAGRKERPNTYKHKAQMGLFAKGGTFQLDSGGDVNGNVAPLITSWHKASTIASRGDSVEILSPTGAKQGVVTNVTNRRGRPRVKVNIQGRSFTFNPLLNHLITQSSDPADIAWLTGDEEYADPDRESFPQSLSDVTIGHLGTGGVWYADLSDDAIYAQTTGPWWTEQYPQSNYSSKVFMAPMLPKATDAQMQRAEQAKAQLESLYPHLPPVNIVRSIDQLEREAPSIVRQIRSELGGGSVNGVRGYMDHITPENGVYIMVPNIYSDPEQTVEQAILETILHETIGHYGVRGVLKDEAVLRPIMNDFVDGFPRLAKHYANRLGLNPAYPEHKQLLGEEMVAYLAGEVLSGTINMTPRQKTLWQRFLSAVRSILHKSGFNRFSPVKKFDAYLERKANTLNDTKQEFWTDEKVVSLISRAQDFVRKPHNFSWASRYGEVNAFMRDGDIFQAGMVSAIDSATTELTNSERKQLAQKLGVEDFKTLPKEQPLFPRTGTIADYKMAITKGFKANLFTKKELAFAGLDEKGDYYFFRDATYNTLRQYIKQINGGAVPSRWYRDILPKHLSDELDVINDLLEKSYISGPLRPSRIDDEIDQYGNMVNVYKFPTRPSLIDKEFSAEMQRARIEEILNQPLNKKTKLTKDLLKAHMVSNNVFRVYVEKEGGHPAVNRMTAIRKLYGDTTREEREKFTPEQEKAIAQEVNAIRLRGFDIGYDPHTQRWLDWETHTSDYSSYAPEGARYLSDYRVQLIKTAGRNGEMANSVGNHFNPNLLHIRTGLAKLLEWDGMPELQFPNPEKEGQLLSLIELQSDWLQKLRKGFASEEQRSKNEQRINAARQALAVNADQFGQELSAQMWTGVKSEFTKLLNMPEPTATVLTGEYAELLEQKALDDYGQPWSELAEAVRVIVWQRVLENKLASIKTKHTNLILDIQEMISESPRLGDLPGTMDARAFQALDYILVTRIMERIQVGLENINNKIDRSIITTQDRNYLAQFVEELQTSFMPNLQKFGSDTRDTVPYRLPMVGYALEKPLKKIYKALDADETLIGDLLKSSQSRDQATVRIPIETINDLNAAMKSSYDPVALVNEMMSPSRISRHSNIRPGAIALSALNVSDTFIDIQVSGDKSAIMQAGDLVPMLIKTWVESYAEQKRQLNIRDATRRGRTEQPISERVSYEDIVEELGLDEADVEAGDSLTSEYGIQTYQDYYEDRISDEIADVVASEVENIAWDDIDWEGVTRDSDEYRSRLVIDDDGTVDNDDAETYLTDQRDEYIASLDDDESIREQAADNIRDLFDSETAPFLSIGQLPVEWDENGDEVGFVDIDIKAASPGAAYDIHIDGDEVGYYWNLESAKDSLSEHIQKYYNENRITVPFGTLFGPEEEAVVMDQENQPDWDLLKSNITSNLSMMSDNPIELKKSFADYTNSMKYKQSDWGGVYPESPLGADKDWRPIAFKYLVADAVRRGLGGIMWNNGLSSSKRGGMGLSGHIKTSAITWSRETVEISGGEREVYVINMAELSAPFVLDTNALIPSLGRDVAELLEAQEKGEANDGLATESSEDKVNGDPKDHYIISVTEDGGFAGIYRRINNAFLGFVANNEEAINEKITGDFAENKWAMIQEQNQGQSPTLKPVGKVIKSGTITAEQVGGEIFLIKGDTQNYYTETFERERLAGARESYESITVSHFNKELKKYGAKVGTTYVQVNDKHEAYAREGQPALNTSAARESRIAEEHGRLFISEMAGQMHGWLVMSEKRGPVVNDVFDRKLDAQQRLESYINDTYGTSKDGVKVFYFPITEKMREDFSGPVAPFHYDPRRDPNFKAIAEKFDYKPTPLREIVAQWRESAIHEFQQGALDQFYGLKKALIDTDNDLGPYMSARLTTSLDAMMKGVLHYGHPVWRDGVVQSEGRGLLDILQPIVNDPKTWGMYMAGRRAKSLMLEGYDSLDQDAKQRINAAIAATGDSSKDALWKLIVAHSNKVLDSHAEVQPDSLTQEERDSLSEIEKRFWDEGFLDHTKRKNTRVTNAPSHRWQVFNWKVVSSNNPQKNIDLKMSKALAWLNEQGLSEAQGRKALDKLTDLALKKQEQADKNRSDKVNAKKAIDSLVSGGREHLFEAGEIDRMIKLGDAFPQFERVAKDYAEFNSRILDFGVASGIIDPDTRATWESADYVPFYRVEDDRLSGSGMSPTAGIANQRTPIRRLRGTNKNVGDIVNNIFMNITKIVDASVKNNAAIETVDALRGTGLIDNKPKAWIPQHIPMSEVKRVLIENGIIVPDSEKGVHLSDIPEAALNGFVKMFSVAAPSGPGIISVMRNGKKEYYETDDMLLYRSMASMNRKAFGSWIRMFTGPKRFLTASITVDPGFVAANVMRDTGSAFVISRDNFNPLTGALKGFFSALVEDESMRTMTSAGAAFENGYHTGGDPDATRRLLKRAMKNKGFIRTVLETPISLYRAWKHISAASENANRIAVYEAAIRAGKPIKQALYESKDLMDFSMSGDWGAIQFLIQTVPFMNARAQGNYRLGRGMMEHPIKFAMKGSLVAMAGMAVFLRFKDDERYKELEDWDKRTYFHFWVGEEHYRIPRPFEVGALFNTLPEMIWTYLEAQEPDRAEQLGRGIGYMFAETFSMNPIPQTISPLVESGFNHNFFTGRPVVSYYEQRRLPSEQYRYRTSPTAIEGGRMLPESFDKISDKLRSPLHLEALYRGYTGTAGKYFQMAADTMVRHWMDYPLPPAWEARDIPVVGRFVRGPDPERSTKYQTEVYRLMDKVQAIQGSLSFLAKVDQLDRYDNIEEKHMPYIEIAKSLNNYREAIQNINQAIMIEYLDEKSTPEHKRDVINELERERNILFKEAYELRPEGNTDQKVDVSKADIIEFIDTFGVNNSKASLLFLEDKAPSTKLLIETIYEDLGKGNLESIAKAGGSK